MKLKIVDGHAVVRDGKPIYVHSDGSEEAFDAPAAMKYVRGQAFASSKYIAEKLNLHHELASAYFGDAFRLQNGQLVAYSGGGVPMYSHVRAGELANLDEALEQLVAKYPSKDKILRSDGERNQTQRQITRAEFDAMSHMGRASYVASGGSVVNGDSAAQRHITSGQVVGDRTVSRATFDAMTQQARAEHVRGGGNVSD